MANNNLRSVAIIVCAWPPNGGGIGNNAYYQALKLAKRGWPIGVLTPDFHGILKNDLPFSFFNLRTFLHIGKAGFMLGLFKELKSYEIVHLYYPFFGSDLLIWIFKKFHPKVKVVLHYEMDPVAPGFKGLIFYLYIKLFLGLMVKAADKIGVLSLDHANNSYLKKYLKKNPEKFIELPNGIDTAIFQPQEKDPTLMSTNNFSVHDKIAIFVGGLDTQHYFKGVPILLEAFSKIPVYYFPDVISGDTQRGLLRELRGESKLLIIGDGNLRSEFEKLAKELGLDQRVRFIGWVKNEDLPDYYALADLLVLPSTEKIESFGIVVAEAQACGLPVIVSDWPGVRSTLIDGETGYLIGPNNVDDLADKLKVLFGDDRLRVDFGLAGSRRAQEKYAWSKIIQQLEQIYKSL